MKSFGGRASTWGSRQLASLLAIALTVLVFGACSSAPDVVLTVDGAQGREIANSSGCAACHGKNGQGITAPKWQGLYESRVPLKSGGSVVADRDYLYLSITEPQAQIHDGFNLKMPQNNLTDDQVELVIAYITELQ